MTTSTDTDTDRDPDTAAGGPGGGTQAAGGSIRPPRGPITQPRLGPLGWARWAWRQLTSMRTALFLLLLLSVAAVPGSIFPQRSIDSVRVTDYLNAHPTLGPVLDRLSVFDVYSSPWFASIYLLLVVSLVGCIVPRSRLHWRAIRAQPPRAPRRLERLPDHLSFTYAGTAAEAHEAARKLLRRKRFRVHAHDGDSVSAEGGYLRETGNLVFHIALCAIIVGVAASHLVGWRGDVIVSEGESFGSTISSFNTLSPGPLTNLESDIPPFTIDLTKLRVRFEEQVGGSQLGAPREFTAYVKTTEQPGQKPVEQTISPNNPITLDGVDVFLLGNGYSPVITVKDAQGKVLYSQATPFLAQDNNYTSTGAIKVPSSRPQQLGFSAVFMPTAATSFANGPLSTFPDLLDPEVAMSVWEGNLYPGGRPQSVYSLSTAGLKQVDNAAGKPLLIRLKPGQSYELPGGRGTVSFDRVERWAGLSARVDPGKGFTLFAALATLLGLLASLLVRRRRVFVRVAPAPAAPVAAGAAPDALEDTAPRTVVTIGGLAKNVDPGLAALLTVLRDELNEERTRHDR
ncbi:MAG: cytochrome c biogenesis protein ResB [Actinomycetota bacterium]|nr:cytochrome c biogenesis protein ResB [Actinomycetota bacterium]